MSPIEVALQEILLDWHLRGFLHVFQSDFFFFFFTEVPYSLAFVDQQSLKIQMFA